MGGGNSNKLRQSLKKIFSQIKTQTFTKLRSAFIFSIKRARKITKNISICCAILTRLTALSNLFLPKIRSILFSRNFRLRLKNQACGYVLILMIALIPVLLFGTKYVLEMKTSTEYYKNPSDYYKNCAREVALAVAKKWNPGLTLYQHERRCTKLRTTNTISIRPTAIQRRYTLRFREWTYRRAEL